jgi:hypothetical protein
MSKERFIPRINVCDEHIAVANMAVNRAMPSKKTLYMLVLDMGMFLDLFLIFNLGTISLS